MNNETAYRVHHGGDKYKITNEFDRVILECRDQGSAQHYATLLNQAYELGYKKGVKETRMV